MIRRLPKTVHEKVWGSPQTSPWHQNAAGVRIGEIWFEASDKIPLLVKLLFASENLSVQVHPKDDYAAQYHNSRGKTEMWHILKADPGASIALGLRKSTSREELKAASLSGEVMDWLNWIPVQPGETYFVPAGTIHAIGGGLTLCEVQQHSDITYRLFDYGRPRELHLDHGVAVSDVSGGPQSPASLPVESAYFRTDTFRVHGSRTIAVRNRNQIYIALAGSGSFGAEPFSAGEGFEVGAEEGEIAISSADAEFLVTEAR